MNYIDDNTATSVTDSQTDQFQKLMTRLFQCCQERMHYQSERFNLPDAELRCLLLFQNEHYLTPKGVSLKLNVVKSRVTRILEGLIKKKLIHNIRDPEDSRVKLLSLTSKGQKKIEEISVFLREIHKEVLNQFHPDQRKAILTHLELLKIALESVREWMV